jgi:hypothetical protein
MKKKLKDVENIRKSLISMDWDKLASSLMNLEIEFNEKKASLSKTEQDVFNLLILLHEQEKATRIERTINPTKFLEDEQFVAYDWTNDIIDD